MERSKTFKVRAFQYEVKGQEIVEHKVEEHQQMLKITARLMSHGEWTGVC